MICMECLKRFSIFEVGQKLQLDCDLGWGKGWRNFPSRGSREVSHTQIGWGKSRFFKQPGKSECVSDLCDFLTRTSIVQSKSLTTPPIRTTKDVCHPVDDARTCNLTSSRFI